MSRYITFTEGAQRIIDECFTLAEGVYGGDYSEVRILAGNYAGYGKYTAHYVPKSKIVEIPLNSSFDMARLTAAGIDIKNIEEFKGTLLHELGHHFVHHVLPLRRTLVEHLDAVKAGHSTHTDARWCYVCACGWNYFDTGLDINHAALARGIRKKVPGLAEAMAKFDPYRPPYEILSQLPTEDGYTNTCQYCKKTFVSVRPDAKFCSPRCRVTSNRMEKR